MAHALCNLFYTLQKKDRKWAMKSIEEGRKEKKSKIIFMETLLNKTMCPIT